MKRRTQGFIGCIAATIALINPVRAGVDQWTVTGPEGGFSSAVYYVPNKAGTALVSNGHAIYRTTDNGLTWALALQNVPNYLRAIAAVPTNPNRIVGAGAEP